jgi:hypothetical protein
MLHLPCTIPFVYLLNACCMRIPTELECSLLHPIPHFLYSHRVSNHQTPSIKITAISRASQSLLVITTYMPLRPPIQNNPLSRQRPRPSLQRPLLLLWPLLHQLRKSQILPRSLLNLLRRPLDPKCRMLIRHYIVLIFRIDGLVVWRDVYLVVWEFVFAKVFEEVRVPGPVEVDVGVGRVFGLERVSHGIRVERVGEEVNVPFFDFEAVL